MCAFTMEAFILMRFSHSIRPAANFCRAWRWQFWSLGFSLAQNNPVALTVFCRWTSYFQPGLLYWSLYPYFILIIWLICLDKQKSTIIQTFSNVFLLLKIDKSCMSSEFPPWLKSRTINLRNEGFSDQNCCFVLYIKRTRIWINTCIYFSLYGKNPLNNPDN